MESDEGTRNEHEADRVKNVPLPSWGSKAPKQEELGAGVDAEMYVLFIRHGRRSLPYAIPEEGTLDGLGIKQAKLTAETLIGQGIERLFSSPYPRAMQTARYISRAIGLPVEIRHRIHEKGGPGNRGTRSQIAAKFPEFIIPDDMPEEWWPDHTETWEDVRVRVKPAVEEFRGLEGKHERIAIVAHGDSMDAMIAIWMGIPLRDQGIFHHYNCGLFLLSQDEGKIRIRYANRNQHLEALGSTGIFD